MATTKIIIGPMPGKLTVTQIIGGIPADDRITTGMTIGHQVPGLPPPSASFPGTFEIEADDRITTGLTP